MSAGQTDEMKRGYLHLAAPGAWAAFVWGMILVASQADTRTFNLAIRGIGIVQYSPSIAFVSASFQVGILFAAALVSAVLELYLLSRKTDHLILGLGGIVVLAAGLILRPVIGDLSLVLLAVGFVPIAFDSASRLAAQSGIDRREPLGVAFLYFVAVFAAIVVVADLRWVVGGLDGSTPFGGLSWAAAVAIAQLLGMLAPVLPELVLLFFFSWAVRIGIGSRRMLSWPNETGGATPSERPLKWLPWAMLLAAVGFALFVGAYPYLKAVNPSSTLVGVDVRSCYSHLLENTPVTSPCGNSLSLYGNERAGAFWLLLALERASGSAQAAVEAAPSVWGTLLVIGTFFFVSEGTGDRLLAGVSALFASVSMESVAGIDAGLLADWLGLSLALLFFAAVFRGMRTKNLLYLLPAFALFAGLLATHPWTWAVSLATLGVFLTFELGQAAYERKLGERRFEFGLLASLVVLGLVADLARSVFPGGSGLLLSLKTVLPALSLSNVPLVASNLVQSLDTYLGGALANPVWFVFGALGVFAIPTLRGRFGKLLVSWLAVMSFGVLLVGPPTNLLQSRMIYDVPLQVFAALGVVAVIGLVQRSLPRGRLPDLAASLTFLTVFGLSLGFALEYVGFLYI